MVTIYLLVCLVTHISSKDKNSFYFGNLTQTSFYNYVAVVVLEVTLT